MTKCRAESVVVVVVVVRIVEDELVPHDDEPATEQLTSTVPASGLESYDAVAPAAVTPAPIPAIAHAKMSAPVAAIAAAAWS